MVASLQGEMNAMSWCPRKRHPVMISEIDYIDTGMCSLHREWTPLLMKGFSSFVYNVPESIVNNTLYSLVGSIRIEMTGAIR